MQTVCRTTSRARTRSPKPEHELVKHPPKPRRSVIVVKLDGIYAIMIGQTADTPETLYNRFLSKLGVTSPHGIGVRDFVIWLKEQGFVSVSWQEVQWARGPEFKYGEQA